MGGVIALAGGDEFRPAYQIADRALLALLPPGLGPIVIVPTAAAHEGPGVAIANGVRHFRVLARGIQVTGALVVDVATANDALLAQRLASAGMVYLTGGDPWHLVQTLCASAALEALRTVLRRGGIVAGSSAGAMALCEWMRGRGFRGWEAGLGLAPGLVVLPHQGETPGDFSGTRGDLPADVVALGIPSGVNCVSLPGADAAHREWQVLGSRPVTIYRASEVRQAREGETFVL
jgi:cyanophycinase